MKGRIKKRKGKGYMQKEEEDDSRTDGGTKSTRLSRQKVRRSIPEEDVRYIEIIIVIDNVLHMQLTDQIDVDIKTVVENINMLYSSKLNINVQLVAMVEWDSKDQITVNDNMRETYEGFLDFNTQTLSSRYTHDSAYLLSGHTFTDSASYSYGISSFRALCSQQGSAGLIQVQESFNVSSVSSVLAHLIGVSLGMPADIDSCSCSTGNNCVMNSLNTQIPADFSQCSLDAFNSFVQSGRGWCLNDFSTVISNSPPVCGNGILEANEQCDCGSDQNCAQCCKNCSFISGAQCSGGPCCNKNCKFHTSGKMCRKTDGECDIPDFCSGQSSQCPTNTILLDGQPCNREKGVCVSGSCLSRTSQCTYLWGEGAVESTDTCYPEIENNSHSRFCGYMYCNITKAPETGSIVLQTANVTTIDDRKICRAASIVLPDGTNLGLLFEGNSCDFGSGKSGTCFHKECIGPSFGAPDSCPGNSAQGFCSSNGVCSSQSKCVCACGWTGSACNITNTRNGAITDLLTGSSCPSLSTTKTPGSRQGIITVMFQPQKPPAKPAETSRDPAKYMTSAIIGGCVALLFVVAVIFGATSIGFRVKRSRMSIFQPTQQQKVKLNKMENDRIMKTKRLKDKLVAQKKARKAGNHLKGPSGGNCCSDSRLPKDRPTERLLVDMETEYRPSSRAKHNETVM